MDLSDDDLISFIQNNIAASTVFVAAITLWYMISYTILPKKSIHMEWHEMVIPKIIIHYCSVFQLCYLLSANLLQCLYKF
ncbi:hypothetical protein BDQ17DRAFT_1375946 [Cyathus striatus]|nr:hypothetical protein BDQ17DRAFT_1375946 [Cyathus striatus]